MPILVFSPADTAVAKLFEDNKLGYVVNETSRNELSEIIHLALTSKDNNNVYMRNSLEYVKSNRECSTTNKRFQTAIIRATNNK